MHIIVYCKNAIRRVEVYSNLAVYIAWHVGVDTLPYPAPRNSSNNNTFSSNSIDFTTQFYALMIALKRSKEQEKKIQQIECNFP